MDQGLRVPVARRADARVQIDGCEQLLGFVERGRAVLCVLVEQLYGHLEYIDCCRYALLLVVLFLQMWQKSTAKIVYSSSDAFSSASKSVISCAASGRSSRWTTTTSDEFLVGISIVAIKAAVTLGSVAIQVLFC